MECLPDGVDTDGVVGVTTEEGVAVSRPCKGDAGRSGAEVTLIKLRLDLINEALALKIPDLDGTSSGSAQPVTVGREDEGGDDVSGVEGVETAALLEIPEEGSSVATTRGAKGTIGRDGDGVDVSGVTNEVGAELAVVEVEDLDNLIPSSRDNQGVGGVGGECHSGDPLSMGITVRDGVLALTESVPQLDGAVTGSRDDLTVVRGEGNGENVLAVTDESAGGLSRVQVPKTKSVVP